MSGIVRLRPAACGTPVLYKVPNEGVHGHLRNVSDSLESHIRITKVVARAIVDDERRPVSDWMSFDVCPLQNAWR
jgi:hypothetical protein